MILKQEVAGSKEQTAWLLIAFDDEREHAGNEGYAEDTEKSYAGDSKVRNSKQIRVGDLAVLRAKSLLGIARIDNIAEAAGQKPIKRWPSCSRTSIKERSEKLPKCRCQMCHPEFDEPIREDVEVTEYEVIFGDSFVACAGAIAMEVLPKFCPNYNGRAA